MSVDSEDSIIEGMANALRVRRNRGSGNLHNVLREFVNSIMNNMFMTHTQGFLSDAGIHLAGCTGCQNCCIS